MRDRLVAGDADVTANRGGGLYPHGLCPAPRGHCAATRDRSPIPARPPPAPSPHGGASRPTRTVSRRGARMGHGSAPDVCRFVHSAEPTTPLNSSPSDRRDDDRVALRLEQRRAALRPRLAGDEDRERAAALGRHVEQVEVLDVDPLRPERLRDPREHARAGRECAPAASCSVAGIGIRLGQQPPPVLRRLADPARQVAGVGLVERASRAPRRGAGARRARARALVGVLEEDVDPDPRVRAGHAGHVPQRPAGAGERLVAVHARRADLVHEHVGERVRDVARQRDELVVRARDRPPPEPARARTRTRAATR